MYAAIVSCYCSSAGVGKQLLLACGVEACPAHDELFPAVFKEKRGRSKSTLRTIKKLC